MPTVCRSNDFCSSNSKLSCCFIHDLTYDVFTQESVRCLTAEAHMW